MYFFSTHSLPMLEKLAPNYDGFFQEQAIKKKAIWAISYVILNFLAFFLKKYTFLRYEIHDWAGKKLKKRTLSISFSISLKLSLF